MAQKNKKTVHQAENVLPQNILLIGEREDGNKNIYISQSVYKEIRIFTKNKTTNESGGMLIGKVIEEFGKTNIIINGFIEAKYCDATPTTLKFTHKTWEYCHSETEKRFPKQKIVGWIHTHPDFGIFLSEYDKFIQENFFKEDYQIAYVIDPIQKEEGFYFWDNEKIEKSKGFYKFDKNGKRIDSEETFETEEDADRFDIKNIIIGALVVSVIILIFSSFSQSQKLKRLVEEQESIEDKINAVGTQQQMMGNEIAQVFSYQGQEMTVLAGRIKELEKIHNIEFVISQTPTEGSEATTPETESKGFESQTNIETVEEQRPNEDKDN